MGTKTQEMKLCNNGQENQTIRSTSRAKKIETYGSGSGITIFEVSEDGYKRVVHEVCKESRVWDWPRYQGGACRDCELKFQAEWEKWSKSLAANIDWYLHCCGIGKRHRRCTIENFEGLSSIKKACKAIADNPSDTVLTGLPGTGKTHLVGGMARAMILNGLALPLHDHEPRVIFETVPDLFFKIRTNFGKHVGDSESGIVGRLSKIPVLLLDDLGSERPSEWVTTTLYTIIDTRYREERPTLLTTNLSLDEIASRLHPRIASRLSSGKIIELTGPDYRAKRSA